MIVVRVAMALLSLLPFAAAYAAGTAWEQLRCGWSKARTDVRRTHGGE